MKDDTCQYQRAEKNLQCVYGEPVQQLNVLGCFYQCQLPKRKSEIAVPAVKAVLLLRQLMQHQTLT